MRFDDDTLAKARAQLLGPRSDELIGYMHAHGLSWDTGGFDAEVVQIARDLGWVAGPGDRPTQLGICAADSCREYRFWVERDRQLPFAGAAPHLETSAFRGRQVLEIGSGMGANLMSLIAAGSEALGVEPVEVYIQMGEIFCEREGVERLNVQHGAAEALPFKDNEIDQVLCVTAHQYFDLNRALDEISRVLRPGGEAIIIGGTLGPFLFGAAPDALKNPKTLVGVTITAMNTLSYSWFGRRVMPAVGEHTTTRPIYPAPGAMIRMLRRANLTPVAPISRIRDASCFFAQAK